MTQDSGPDLACHVSSLVEGADPATLAPALAGLREAGYRRAVLPPLDAGAVDAGALRAVFEESGLAPIAMAGQTPEADVSSADDTIRTAGAALLREAIDFAVAIGADQLTGVSYGVFGKASAPVTQQAFERSARAVGQAADEATERGVTLSFEVLNRYETAMINTARRALEFVEASGSEQLRIHLDTFHMAIEETDMSAAIRAAMPRLAYLELGQSARGLISTGAIDLHRVIAQALDDGYTGRWGVEAFSRPLVGGPAGDALAIWRAPYDDGLALAADAAAVVRRGWQASVPGRRAQRLARAGG